jgi:ankyrin repeat protein
MAEAQIYELVEAIESGLIENVRESLDRGARVDEITEEGDTVLHIAASENAPGILRFLLEQVGTDVNFVNDDGDSPLHIACLRDFIPERAEMVRMLLYRGARVNARNHENGPENDESAGGRTPLHNAITQLSIPLVQILLEHGADMSITEKEGYNALHWAVQMHSTAQGILDAREVIDLLLSHETDIDRKIALLRATTGDGVSFDPETAEELATSDDLKIILRDALQTAVEAHRAKRTDAFRMGQHWRLGEHSHVPTIDPDVVRMILDMVVSDMV